VTTDLAPPQPESAGADASSAPPANYFEIYKLAVEMADRISARRMLANTFFVTMNTGLAALLGAHSFHWYVAGAGMVLSIVWWALLKSYRDLNTAKYEVILAMEDRLPARILGDEWATLKREPIKLTLKQSTLKERFTEYWELGSVERIIPWIFVVIYVVALVSQSTP